MIHKDIGLAFIPDQHAGNPQSAKNYVNMFFTHFYHIGVILDTVEKALNEAPRKLHYNSVVSFLQYNRPAAFKSDPEEFLYHCFDTEGRFTRNTVAYVLWKMGVLMPCEEISVVEKRLFPPLDPVAHDEIRRSLDVLRNSLKNSVDQIRASAEGPPLSKSRDLGQELRYSTEVAAHHECEETKKEGGSGCIVC